MKESGWYNGYSWKEREAKLQELKRLIARGELLPASGPCDLCGDPDVPVEYHDEDYSKPYMWKPPALFALCRNCHRHKLHRRFLHPASWQAFLAHVRRGGYARDLKNPAIKREVMEYQSAVKRGEKVSLKELRPHIQSPGEEWFAALSVDPVTISPEGPRPRPSI
jgi:hypothetical protein